jgi:hypothetical protein
MPYPSDTQLSACCPELTGEILDSDNNSLGLAAAAKRVVRWRIGEQWKRPWEKTRTSMDRAYWLEEVSA